MEPLTPYPRRVTRLIEKWHAAGGITGGDCLACASTCCRCSGFALIQNVKLAYEVYRRGELVREDYEFTPGLSLKGFATTYFDEVYFNRGGWLRKRPLVAYFPRILTGERDLVSVPAGTDGYYALRATLLDYNGWMSRGCVFLSKRLPEPNEDDDGDTSRRCILHHPDSATHVTQKPIDCVFHTCGERGKMTPPDQRTGDRWYVALAKSWPDSLRDDWVMRNEECIDAGQEAAPPE